MTVSAAKVSDTQPEASGDPYSAPPSDNGKSPASASPVGCQESFSARIVYGSGFTEHFNVEGPGSYRLERSRPSRVQAGWSAAADEMVNIHHFGDNALAERVIRLRRAIEDAVRLGRDSTVDERDLRVTTSLQYVRRRLRLRYGARDAYGPTGDQGTDVREHWEKFDERPSYALAFAIDRERFERGRPAIVAWGCKGAVI